MVVSLHEFVLIVKKRNRLATLDSEIWVKSRITKYETSLGVKNAGEV